MLHFLSAPDGFNLRLLDRAGPVGIGSANRVVALRPPLDEQPVVFTHFNHLYAECRSIVCFPGLETNSVELRAARARALAGLLDLASTLSYAGQRVSFCLAAGAGESKPHFEGKPTRKHELVS